MPNLKRFLPWFVALVGTLFSFCALAASAPTESIRVVVDDNYPPYSFRDSNGQLQGIVPDRWQLWQEKTGIKVSLTGMDWGLAQKTMLAGNADAIDTLFETPERQPLYEFSAPYARLEVLILFHQSISGINNAESLVSSGSKLIQASD